MANVKFYRLGKEAPVSAATYNAAKTDPADGRIIFARVIDEIDPSIINLYIWANGIEYKVADDNAFDILVEKVNLLSIDVSTLSDDSSEGGLYTNPDSVHYWIQQAIIEAELTAEKVYAIVDPSNKIPASDSSAAVAIARSTEGVKVSLTQSEGVDSSLLVGIDLDKIYLPHGVQRTEAIGVLPASDQIVTEGVGMSVKELLEYYLVKEKFPETTTVKGSGSFSNYSMTVGNLPKSGTSFKDYVKVNSSAISNNQLVEIGSTLSVQSIANTLSYTTAGTVSSVESDPASAISGMTFGYCTALGEPTEDGHYMPGGIISTETSKTAATGVATATYTIKNSGVNVNSTLSINGNSITSSDTDAYSFDASTVLVEEGENKVSLSLTHDASITCSYENLTIPGIDKIYVISNKGHVSEDVSVGVTAGTIGTASGSVNKYTTSSVSVIGVYPIFTNGKVVGATANENTFNWYNDTYSTDPTDKLTLVNYLSANQTYIISFGATNATNGYKCYMFVPKNLTFTVPQAADLDGSGNIYDWIENTQRNKSWTKETTTTITVQGKSVEYDVYSENSTAGAWAYKVQINKK